MRAQAGLGSRLEVGQVVIDEVGAEERVGDPDVQVVVAVGKQVAGADPDIEGLRGSRPSRAERKRSQTLSCMATWLQRLLEEEVEELLGRRRYERREGIEIGYRNGFA